MTKKELRKHFKKAAETLSSEYIESASKKITDYVTDLPEFKNSDTVFIYISTAKEPQTLAIIEKAWSMNKTVCVPKCISENRMAAVVINSWNDVSPGAMGISEPVVCTDTVSRKGIDIALIPCVASDRAGSRLGHGAGYYDRFLKETDIKKVCLCFEKNLFEQIPADSNDVPMDLIISETAVYNCGNAEQG